uniref:Peptidase_M41 domain-containing protein n=1 Tax=Meloidogyne hapla TaxID=6305 RepID=A0A1I8B456_MELHA
MNKKVLRLRTIMKAMLYSANVLNDEQNLNTNVDYQNAENVDEELNYQNIHSGEDNANNIHEALLDYNLTDEDILINENQLNYECDTNGGEDIELIKNSDVNETFKNNQTKDNLTVENQENLKSNLDFEHDDGEDEGEEKEEDKGEEGKRTKIDEVKSNLNLRSIKADCRWRLPEGSTSTSINLTDKEKSRVAHHEGGHAVLARLLTIARPVKKVSIIPAGDYLGLTEFGEDKIMEIFQDCKDKLDIMQAGGAAEEHFFNSYSTAAANDFKKATDFAILMVQVFGFSKKMKTFVSFPEASEHIKLMQNEEAMELVHESWYRTKDSVKLYEKKIAKFTINSSQVLPPKKVGENMQQLGNKTECGLLGFVLSLGQNYQSIRDAYPEERIFKVTL